MMTILFLGCDDDDGAMNPALDVPTTYQSTNFATNVTAENTVVDELSTVTGAVNDAESNAQTTPVAAIPYPATLNAVTLPAYRDIVSVAIDNLVLAANDDDGFQNPGLNGTPAAGEEGGLLGSRLLDEHGLELEQMIQKGSFGAALYNHALTVINGDLSNSSAIDKLVEIHGTEPTFDVSETTAAATYSRRRSDLDAETGFFFDIRDALLTAKAAIEQGDDFREERDQALEDYLNAWERSNFATVIYYANATRNQLTAAFALPEGDDRDAALGNALHAYAEGVAFTAGFRGIADKQITDAQIDSILELLMAPYGQTPESHRFLNEASLLSNLQTIIDDIQLIYGFTDAEVNGFYVNNNP